MYRPTIGLILPALVHFTHAWIHLDAVCFDSCSEAADYITWGDSVNELDYYAKVCKDGLHAQSAYLCARFYCNEQQIQDGLAYLNSGICEMYGKYPAAPLSIVSNVTDEEIKNMPRYGSATIAAGTILNRTAIPDREYYALAYKTVYDFAYQLNIHVLYGWAMYIFWGAVIFISLLTKFIAYLHRSYTRPASRDSEGNTSVSKQSSLWKRYSSFTTYISTSATFGTRCAEPYWWCTVPPLIETLTVIAFIVVNVVLCCVSYSAFNFNIYWPEKTVQIWRYIADRTGIICFANLPLLWAFGSRNNVLLWLTGWSFSTFNTFHRWVARIATLEAVIHSVAWTVEYFLEGMNGYYYYQEWKSRFFWTGAIATIAMCLMLGFAAYPVRKHWYEFFLYTHIAWALITVVTLFYHVQILGDQYKPYLWAVVAIWVLDRVARLARIVMLNWKMLTGSRTATAWYSGNSETIYIDTPMSIDVKMGAGTNYYVYLLHGWLLWENHPFTATSVIDSSSTSSINSDSQGEDEIAKEDTTKNTTAKAESTLSLKTHRVRFAIRPYGGFTARLRRALGNTAPDQPKPIRVLIEGPYGHAAGVKNFDHNLLVIGGSGITAALSHLESTVLASSSSRRPAISLHWSVRHIAAFEEFRDELAAFSRSLDTKITVYVTREPITEVEKVKQKENVYPAGWSVQYGRMSVTEVIRGESDDSVGSTAVVGCGPARMMDEARASVVHCSIKEGKDIQYYQESFGW